MAKRLVKVAKEFNVGTGTLVEYLVKNGFDIENKPTAKVDDTMYGALLKEYSKDLAIKEKAEQLKKENQPEKKRETVTLRPNAGITTISATPPPRPPAPAPKPVVAAPKPVAPAPAPVVVEAKKAEPTPSPIVPTPPPAPVAVEKKDSKRIENSNGNFGLKIKGKINLDNVGKKRGKSKPTKEAPRKAAPVEAKQEKPAPVVVKAPKAPVVKPVVKEVKPEAAKPVEKAAPRADTSAQPTKPVEKAPVEGSTPPPVIANKDKGIIRAAAPELRGLKIKGKINLANIESSRGKKKKDEKKSAPVASSDGSGGNRRRRRRRSGDSPQGGGGQGQGQGQRSTGTGTAGAGGTRTSGGSGPRTSGGGASRTSGGGRTSGGAARTSGGARGRTSGGRATTGRGRSDVKEVSAKEIEDKIKATMARLSGSKRRRQKIKEVIAIVFGNAKKLLKRKASTKSYN